MFCDKYSPTPTCPSSISKDQVNWFFDQDCTSDYNSGIGYANWFIIKVPVSSFTSASIDTLPESAANFGDANGNLYATAMALDHFGNIYIHGYSDSQAFGGARWTSPVSNQWVHGKTHWELTYEVQFNQWLNNNGKVSYSYTTSTTNPTFMDKRFKIPKKFINNDLPKNPSNSGTAY